MNIQTSVPNSLNNAYQALLKFAQTHPLLQDITWDGAETTPPSEFANYQVGLRGASAQTLDPDKTYRFTMARGGQSERLLHAERPSARSVGTRLIVEFNAETWQGPQAASTHSGLNVEFDLTDIDPDGTGASLTISSIEGYEVLGYAKGYLGDVRAENEVYVFRTAKGGGKDYVISPEALADAAQANVTRLKDATDAKLSKEIVHTFNGLDATLQLFTGSLSASRIVSSGLMSSGFEISTASRVSLADGQQTSAEAVSIQGNISANGSYGWLTRIGGSDVSAIASGWFSPSEDSDSFRIVARTRDGRLWVFDPGTISDPVLLAALKSANPTPKLEKPSPFGDLTDNALYTRFDVAAQQDLLSAGQPTSATLTPGKPLVLVNLGAVPVHTSDAEFFSVPRVPVLDGISMERWSAVGFGFIADSGKPALVVRVNHQYHVFDAAGCPKITALLMKKFYPDFSVPMHTRADGQIQYSAGDIFNDWFGARPGQSDQSTLYQRALGELMLQYSDLDSKDLLSGYRKDYLYALKANLMLSGTFDTGPIYANHVGEQISKEASAIFFDPQKINAMLERALKQPEIWADFLTVLRNLAPFGDAGRWTPERDRAWGSPSTGASLLSGGIWSIPSGNALQAPLTPIPEGVVGSDGKTFFQRWDTNGQMHNFIATAVSLITQRAGFFAAHTSWGVRDNQPVVLEAASGGLGRERVLGDTARMLGLTLDNDQKRLLWQAVLEYLGISNRQIMARITSLSQRVGQGGTALTEYLKRGSLNAEQSNLLNQIQFALQARFALDDDALKTWKDNIASGLIDNNISGGNQARGHLLSATTVLTYAGTQELRYSGWDSFVDKQGDLWEAIACVNHALFGDIRSANVVSGLIDNNISGGNSPSGHLRSATTVLTYAANLELRSSGWDSFVEKQGDLWETIGCVNYALFGDIRSATRGSDGHLEAFLPSWNRFPKRVDHIERLVKDAVGRGLQNLASYEFKDPAVTARANDVAGQMKSTGFASYLLWLRKSGQSGYADALQHSAQIELGVLDQQAGTESAAKLLENSVIARATFTRLSQIPAEHYEQAAGVTAEMMYLMVRFASQFTYAMGMSVENSRAIKAEWDWIVGSAKTADEKRQLLDDMKTNIITLLNRAGGQNIADLDAAKLAKLVNGSDPKGLQAIAAFITALQRSGVWPSISCTFSLLAIVANLQDGLPEDPWEAMQLASEFALLLSTVPTGLANVGGLRLDKALPLSWMADRSPLEIRRYLATDHRKAIDRTTKHIARYFRLHNVFWADNDPPSLDEIKRRNERAANDIKRIVRATHFDGNGSSNVSTIILHQYKINRFFDGLPTTAIDDILNKCAKEFAGLRFDDAETTPKELGIEDQGVRRIVDRARKEIGLPAATNNDIMHFYASIAKLLQVNPNLQGDERGVYDYLRSFTDSSIIEDEIKSTQKLQPLDWLDIKMQVALATMNLDEKDWKSLDRIQKALNKSSLAELSAPFRQALALQLYDCYAREGQGQSTISPFFLVYKWLDDLPQTSGNLLQDSLARSDSTIMEIEFSLSNHSSETLLEIDFRLSDSLRSSQSGLEVDFDLEADDKTLRTEIEAKRRSIISTARNATTRGQEETVSKFTLPDIIDQIADQLCSKSSSIASPTVKQQMAKLKFCLAMAVTDVVGTLIFGALDTAQAIKGLVDAQGEQGEVAKYSAMLITGAASMIAGVAWALGMLSTGPFLAVGAMAAIVALVLSSLNLKAHPARNFKAVLEQFRGFDLFKCEVDPRTMWKLSDPTGRFVARSDGLTLAENSLWKWVENGGGKDSKAWAKQYSLLKELARLAHPLITDPPISASTPARSLWKLEHWRLA